MHHTGPLLRHGFDDFQLAEGQAARMYCTCIRVRPISVFRLVEYHMSEVSELLTWEVTSNRL